MKCILFCQNNYAFGILEPIKEYLKKTKHEYIWFITEKLKSDFPYKSDNYTNSISDLVSYHSDAIFVPGNEVPHFLRGLKVQIFHGLAGEKKGHFRIRQYFDLYLTQGPYFTNTFNKLKTIHKDFDVIETGWPKLDVFATEKDKYNIEKESLLQNTNAKKVILYAPTFSPKLTSAPFLVDEIKALAKNPDFVILMKFHPLMDKKWLETYKSISKAIPNIIFKDEKNIVKFLLMADILISDTSSVIYEFLLLDKPTISFRNISTDIYWENSLEYKNLADLVKKNLEEDPYKESRGYIYNQYHPYNDGKSAERMVEAVKEYINMNGVPSKRKISLFRKFKMLSKFGK
jgi:CDP-glycerol glycerophosphotransferase (TagB/SpsB family)